jgi:hypothetical protein
MPVNPIPIAVASALVVVTSTMLASPGQTTQRPGEMTQGHVQIDNRGPDEAIPVDLNLDKPLRVQITNGEPVYGPTNPVIVRPARMPWEYQTVTVPLREDITPRLNALGESGWEATAILAQAERTTILLKRPRQP